MRPHPTRTHAARPRRPHVPATSPSRLLHEHLRTRRTCGHRIELHTDADRRPAAPHPAELITDEAPTDYRRHLSPGTARPGDASNTWRRTPHRLIRPGHVRVPRAAPRPDAHRLRLVLKTRRPLDTGLPASEPHRSQQLAAPQPRPLRRILLHPYPAPTPAQDTSRVAQPSRRHPRVQCLLAVRVPASAWRLLQPDPQRGTGQPPPPAAVHALNRLDRGERLRRRTHRCPDPADDATGHSPTGRQASDPLRHAGHHHTRPTRSSPCPAQRA
ncbi:DUF6083 domain-containing protein [Streptomyces olivaceus]|uniref:DUF6083 domain-containing protein n=1 Tax=Streptomyces olivaceus TaxID=47716 RepID=UPI00405611AB